mgnify:CR=1 FL=1
MFDKMKALMDMQKKMQELKRQLDSTVFEVESSDRLIKITMNGSQELKDVKILSGFGTDSGSCSALEAAIKDAFSRALKRSQDIAAEKMKGVTGFSLPGLG